MQDSCDKSSRIEVVDLARVGQLLFPPEGAILRGLTKQGSAITSFGENQIDFQPAHTQPAARHSNMTAARYERKWESGARDVKAV